jgi:hypothetical protein
MSRVVRLILAAAFAAAVAGSTGISAHGRPELIPCVSEHTTIVPVTIYNRSRLTEAKLAVILATVNKLWVPYGVKIERGHGHGLAVVISPDAAELARLDTAPLVLGTTSFTDGHANAYIRLWLGAAEALAGSSGGEGGRFAVLPNVERDRILISIMGVALAHELAHYLLDTSRHSPDGLLQEAMSFHDLVHPTAERLFLSVEQQEALCASATVRNLPGR